MAPQVQPTFVVDKAGLAKLLARKGKPFAVTELIQNAWDEDTTHVDVVIEDLGGGLAKLVVEDDNPEGFKDLTHAYTLFAESDKVGKADKRGRFNLGEKLVIAICEEASIQTTKGSVVFGAKGRMMLSKKRAKGSVFTGTIRMTAEDVAEVERVVRTLLPPEGITTTFNLSDVPSREPVVTFEVALRTELADDEGRMRPTTRKTWVELYEPTPDETASIYELGIPVVETGDRWHVNVMQKVPLTIDRDNVPPAYLRDVRALVLNHTHHLLTPEDAKASWVTLALGDSVINADAVRAAIIARFGEKVVISDPTDREANKIAAEQGYTVIPGGALPKDVWKHIKDHEIVLPAGQVTPSPNPHEAEENLKLMNPDHYPADVARVVEFSKVLAAEILDGAKIDVRVANDPTWKFAATYGPRSSGKGGLLTLNVGRLGFKWFGTANAAEVIDLLVHEFGHHYCSDHLDREYLNALSALAARSVMVALERPSVFDGARTTVMEAAAA